MRNAIKNIGGGMLALVMLAAVLAAGAACQIAYGAVRPRIPHPVRSLLLNEDTSVGRAEIDARDYTSGISAALQLLLKTIDGCQELRQQSCLTTAFEKAYRSLPDTVPTGAASMANSNDELRQTTYEMWQIHRRSETEPATPAFVDEANRKAMAFTLAVDNWFTAAKR